MAPQDVVIQREDRLIARDLGHCVRCGDQIVANQLPTVSLQLPAQPSLRFHSDCFSALATAMVTFCGRVLPYRPGRLS
jgi:hypothetical protein